MPRRLAMDEFDFEQSGFRTQSWSLQGRDQELRPYHPTVLHAFAYAARLETEVGVTILPESPHGKPEQRSYRKLYHDARRMAAALRGLGVEAGDRVLLVLPTCFDFITCFFGSLLIGAVPAPAYPPSPFRLESSLTRLAHIATHSGARVCVTWGAARPVLGELLLRAPTLQAVADVEEMRRAERLEVDRKCRPEELAFIQYTSGSTGHPKGVALTHANVMANIHAIGMAGHINRKDVMAGWLPLYHDMGLVGQLLWPIYWRIPTVLMSPLAFLSRPERWPQMLHDYQATVSQAPNFGYALCARKVSDQARDKLDLSRVRGVLCGAEPIHAATIDAFVDKFSPCGFRPNAIIPVYGLAESTVGITFTGLDERPRYDLVDREELSQGRATPPEGGAGAMSVACVGRVLFGHSLVIVDHEGNELPERRVGRVMISGPSIMSGYYRDPAATARVLVDGWLYTGDLGYLVADELYITGRAKDLIIINGHNYYAEDVEAAAEKADGVRPGGSVAFGVYDDLHATDSVVIVCETRLEDAAARDQLRAGVTTRVLEQTGVKVEEVVLVAPGTIPKTSSGKRRRSSCAARYRDGTLTLERGGRLRTGWTYLRSQMAYALRRLGRLRRS